MKQCPVCHARISRVGTTGPWPTYCSRACKARAAYRRNPPRLKPRKPQSECLHCGLPVGNARGTYCMAPDCRREYRRIKMRDYFRRIGGNPYRAAPSPITCEWCGQPGTSTGPAARFCSKGCSARYATSCIPPGKPKPLRKPRPAPKPKASRVWFPECGWCGVQFCARQARFTMCSERCSRRAKIVRRKGREHYAPGSYTWVEVIGLFLAFDRRCAYCRELVIGQPDPDHVVALSRGGANSITNILPTCRLCNSDKRDLTLDEWAADRARRGLEPVVTSWSMDDPLYMHLTSVLPASLALSA